MKTIPIITKPIAQKDIFVGTMNPNALSRPLLQRKTVHKSYEQFSQLSEQLEQVKNENAVLQAQLDSMLNAEKPTPFCQFKKWEIDFQDRLKEREKELQAFSRYIDTFRTQSQPTFVRVDAANVRRPDFDSICVSLLVSNPEKYFFNKDDLVQINQQLTILIDQQADALKLLSARLNLFTQFQSRFAIQTTINSLRNNEAPSALFAEAPTRALELKTKRKMLSAELAVLIKARRELVAEKMEKRMKKRRKRNRIKMSIKINSVIRGYLARQKMKKLHQAAVKIQKVWRGYIQRWRQKEAEGFDGKRYRMVKIFKHRINPDGEEQEYYEYEEEEINDVLIKPTKKKHRKHRHTKHNKNHHHKHRGKNEHKRKKAHKGKNDDKENKDNVENKEKIENIEEEEKKEEVKDEEEKKEGTNEEEEEKKEEGKGDDEKKEQTNEEEESKEEKEENNDEEEEEEDENIKDEFEDENDVEAEKEEEDNNNENPTEAAEDQTTLNDEEDKENDDTPQD